MKRDYSTKLLSLAMLLVLFALAIPSMAQDDNVVKTTLDKTQDGSYRISSARDYELFRQIVATGNPYANAVLEGDISVNTSAIGRGSVEFHYRGTFDGQGHTIEMKNLTCNTDSLPWGLFQYTETGCVIKNLKVTGTIVSSTAQHIGALIGSSTGTKIENCICDATIKYDGKGFAGGLVGISYGESFFENCAFIGNIKAPKAEACYGFVGKNVHMVSLKSNYVAATFKVGDTTKTGQFMEVVRKDCQTILNNYACHEVIADNSDDAGEPEDAGKVVDAENGFQEVTNDDQKADVLKNVSLQDITNGTLCLSLNVKGRNGIVWYQYKDRPYPFKVSEGKMVMMTDTGVSIDAECTTHSYDGHICRNCGSIEDGCKIEPLQKRGEIDSEQKVNIGYLRFRINKDRGLKTAELVRRDNAEVNAAHIPETVNFEGEEYRVDYIAKFAFEASNIEYLYIGKNVNHIDDKSFNNCYKLKHIHIADGNGSTLFGTNTVIREELFHESPLETLYIGRNIKWDPDHDCPFQDKDSYKEVFFGPMVTCVGNYWNENDPEEGWYDELFDDSKIKAYYFMGDDSCLISNRTLLVACAEGLEKASKCYVNRTFNAKKGFLTYIQKGIGIMDSVFDNCVNLIYGPYVKNIVEASFNDQGIPFYTSMPKTVDFTNAFNLEEIGDFAFNLCDTTYFIGTFENTKLKKIGTSAFFKCSNLKKIVIPNTVTSIGTQAFSCIEAKNLAFNYGEEELNIGAGAFGDCDEIASVYHGRNMKYSDGCPFSVGTGDVDKKFGTLVIAPEITELPVDLYTDIEKLGALTFAPSDKPLTLKGEFGKVFAFAKGISSMYIGRKIIDHNGEESVSSWGNTIKSSLHDLSYGNTVTEVRDNFNGFTGLQTILFGETVTDVKPGTFKDCTGLKTVFAMGNVTISEEAFKGCTTLLQVFLMGSDLSLSESAFAGCNKINQVVVGLTEDPKKDNSQRAAFTDDVYEKANLVCAGDRQYTKVNFTREPWKSFQHRNNIHASENYEYGHTSDQGEYNRAYLDHHFDKGKYELVYLPFNMDSYYFGSDAAIYRLDHNEGAYNSHSEVLDGRYNIVNVNFKKQDIAKAKTLLNGLYIVNTEHETELLEAHPNLFEGYKISVDNGKQTYKSENLPDIVVNEENKTLDADANAYIYQDGVIKHVANTVNTIPNSVTWYKTDLKDDKELVLNLVDDDSNVLISSNINLGFNPDLEGYTTFYDKDFAYVAPEWCDVYIVIESDTGGSLELVKIPDGIINKDLAVLIKSKEVLPDRLKEYLRRTTLHINAPIYSYNMLRGVSVDSKADELLHDGSDFVYALGNDDDKQKTGFYKRSGDRIIPAGTAYIPPFLLNEEDQSKTCLFAFNENTGIKHTTKKYDANETIYDLMGRSLRSAGFKGIYIISGKKVVVN